MQRLPPTLILLFALFCFAAGGEVQASSAPECPTSRADRPDIAQYKANYKPLEYYPEAAVWQVADIALMAAGLLLAAQLARRRPTWPLTLLLTAALLYFGLWRGGCICPVGAVANATLGLHQPELAGRATAIIFLLPLFAAFFAGRIFCSSVCPLGACQHLLAKKTPVSLPPLAHRISLLPAPLMLFATIWTALSSTLFLVCLLDPYKPAFFLGHAWAKQLTARLGGAAGEPGLHLAGDWTAWAILALTLLLSHWITRPFCRFVCPYGVLLGLLAVAGFRRKTINREQCVYCGQCQRTCPVQAIKINKPAAQAELSNYACIQCNRCNRICPQNAVDSKPPTPRA